MLIVDPGQTYRVSVFNIPKPELEHSSYDVSADVIVPGEFEFESSIWLLYFLFCILVYLCSCQLCMNKCMSVHY